MSDLQLMLTINSIGGAYVLENEEMLEISDKAAVIGGINCAGTEPELLECIHGSDGDHLCHRYSSYPDIIISCTGVYKQFLLRYIIII